eukprot:CAMPEP_0176240200 /NCGR_PEP_ID=MMETSP0121_2-20121125/29252_1 /TAXON_ID=160619 /ORGANISM="Kryptoperidinium foliaceum, Strain CCMP 1326" /LENGTH=36 /DNA_ID= /DNA_START= /DNA_END= /DNA_ORIENTATION=
MRRRAASGSLNAAQHAAPHRARDATAPAARAGEDDF